MTSGELQSKNHRFHCRDAANQTAVVLVHGFLGNLRESWGRMPEFICELPGHDVLLVQYPTGVLRRVPPVDIIGDFLVSQLKSYCRNYEDLVLVGHSLGCLIIESAVAQELRSGRALKSPVSQIRNIVLYAPPHNGSNFAALIGRVPVLLNAQGRFLGANNRLLLSLQDEFANKVYRPSLEPGGERYERKIPLTVIAGRRDAWVPPHVAKFVYSDVDYYLIDGDHSSIKEPEEPSDDPFNILLATLQVLNGRE